MTDNIVVFDYELNKLKSMKLSFPNLDPSIEIDNYRVLWISEPYKSNYIVFASYFNSQSDVDENIGKTLMVWFGEEIAIPVVCFNTLKSMNKVKAHFWDFDHQNDEIIPSFTVEWYENPA